jgi:hypothetical protein
MMTHFLPEAASDVENLEAGSRQQLGGNVPLLGELRVIERSVAVFEISARILQVGIQKQAMDAIIDIVMMDRIATLPPEGVALKDSAWKRPQSSQQATPRVRLNPVEVFDSEVEKIHDRALLDHDAAIHIGFAESELGIDKDAPLGCPRGEADRHGSPRPIPERKGRSSRGRDLKIPHTDQLFDEPSACQTLNP